MSETGHTANGWPVTTQPYTKGANQDIVMNEDAAACGGKGVVNKTCPLTGGDEKSNAHYLGDPVVTINLPAIGKCLAEKPSTADYNIEVQPCSGVGGVDFIAHPAADGGYYLVAIAESNFIGNCLGNGCVYGQVAEVTSTSKTGGAVFAVNSNAIPTWLVNYKGGPAGSPHE
jgi:hypothetical protein